MRPSPAIFILLAIAVVIGLPQMIASLIGTLGNALAMAPTQQTKDPVSGAQFKQIYDWLLDLLKRPEIVAALIALSIASIYATSAVSNK